MDKNRIKIRTIELDEITRFDEENQIGSSAKRKIKDNRPLADFLPTLTIAAKNLATEMTNYNVEDKDLQGEKAITDEHVQNNSFVREMLGQRGIKPEELPPAEDIKKLERRVKSQEKKLAKEAEAFQDK